MIKDLQAARIYAAQIDRDIAACALDPDFGFASHVTHEEKIIYAANHALYACEIEAGLHDDNFTIWQRMNYYSTGEYVPFLRL